MFYMGIIDILSTIYACTLCGIWLIRGDIYCTNPTFLFIACIFIEREIFGYTTNFLKHFFSFMGRRLYNWIYSGFQSNTWSFISKILEDIVRRQKNVRLAYYPDTFYPIFYILYQAIYFQFNYRNFNVKPLFWS